MLKFKLTTFRQESIIIRFLIGGGEEEYTGSYSSITFLDGKVVSMKAGRCVVGFKEGFGYSVAYTCNKIDHPQCALTLSNE